MSTTAAFDPIQWSRSNAYGTVGDGLTDDIAEIQAAENQAAESGKAL